MAEPTPSPEQSLEQRTAELQQQAGDAMAHLKARIAGVRQAQQQAMQANGEATSRDGVVRVVVDGTGVVTSLTLAPSAFDRSTPDRLAQTITATIQSAAAQARGRTSAAMAAIRGDDKGLLSSAAKGAAGLGVPPLPVPEVPRTAVDPTGQQDGWAVPPPAPVEPPAPVVEPMPGHVASNRSRRTDDVDDSADDGSGGWVSDERPW
ncbi:MAG TPA: YbaB/EbfC family nucleoid-associated protein [Pseudonocardiaceae bacterium]|nr:YbaB/EbfC family nucleoid-associated protein [Pseudonocardiaceae bacterium]